jgi:hypothetical protein
VGPPDINKTRVITFPPSGFDTFIEPCVRELTLTGFLARAAGWRLNSAGYACGVANHPRLARVNARIQTVLTGAMFVRSKTSLGSRSTLHAPEVIALGYQIDTLKLLVFVLTS